MALSIEATPELTGKDAVRFLERLIDWEKKSIQPHAKEVPFDLLRERGEELRKEREEYLKNRSHNQWHK